MENINTYKLHQTGPETQTILDQVSTNTADIAQLQDLYQAFIGSGVTIIQPTDTWPVANPEEKVIYRVIDRENTPPESYSDYMWNGTTMVLMATYDNAIDSTPTAGSNNPVASGGVLNYVSTNGSAYDISAANSCTAYADLAAALGTDGANVPEAVRKGGMSVKFVQTSDNKYVQYRYMGTATTGTPNPFLNTDNWAIVGEDVYVENPEYMKVETDAEGKILHSVDAEDGAYWFHKLKSPTLDNMMEDIQDFKEEIEGEVEQAIEDSQTELAQHYDYYNVSKHHSVRDVFNIYTANDGWEQVEYDSSRAQYDALDIYQVGEICNFGGDTEHSYEATSSHRGVAPATITQEYVTRPKFTLEEAIAVLPEEVLTSFAAGQKICFVDLDDFIEEWQITEGGTWERISPYDIKDPEGRIEIKLDAEGKIVAYRKADGTWVECVGIEAPNLGDYVDKEEGKSLIDAGFAESQSTIEDPEGRLRLELDEEGKIADSVEGDGSYKHNTKHVFNGGIELNEKTMTEFQKALKDTGFQPGGGGDWSDREDIELPEPEHYSLLNIVVESLPINDSDVSEGYIEYYDGLGNYFKMSCELAAQGQSSRIFARTQGKGNYTLDLPKDVKFGHWVPQDSFHLKGAAKDISRGMLATSYKLAYPIQEYLDAQPDRVLVDDSGITVKNSTGVRINDWFRDARCLPDGFPVEVYVNGEYWGLYAWQLKKHRKNYSMDKKDYTSFFIDPDQIMTSDHNHGIWNDGPDALIPNTDRTWWTGFDIKGPKDLYCMDGSKFDGDNPKELIDSTSPYYDSTNKAHKGSQTTKNLIKSFQTKYLEVKALIDNDSIEDAKAAFNANFDYNSCMLVYIYNCLMMNGDSIQKNTLWGMYKSGKIFAALWDLDGMYGQEWTGTWIYNPSAYLFNSYANSAWPLGLFWTLYETEIKAAYSSLRRDNIISIDSWEKIVFSQWFKKVDQYAFERDLERWPETPSYRENYTNADYWEEVGISREGQYPIWNAETEYSVDDVVLLLMHPTTNWCIAYKAVQGSTNVCPVTKFYEGFPQVGGFYDSPKRWKKWMEEQLRLCDVRMGYSE